MCLFALFSQDRVLQRPQVELMWLPSPVLARCDKLIAKKGDILVGSVNQALCVCCFGRGGSSLLWHLLGSSPDIWMMRNEWHQAVFGESDLLRRSLRHGIRNRWLHHLGNGKRTQDRILQRFAHRRVLSNMAQDQHFFHPDAKFACMKVMDYNVFWHDGITQSFGGGRTVLLLRRPLPQCESLIRSGLKIEEAIRKYNDVSKFLADLAARPGVVIVHFGALLEDPAGIMAATYGALGVVSPLCYVAKVKPYGAARQVNTDVSERKLRVFSASELRDFVDPSVDDASAKRLSGSQADQILSQTRSAAERLGY